MARLIGNVDATGSLSTSVSTPATNASAVSLYLPFDSSVTADGSAINHSITANGGANISSTQAKFGSNSAAFDGSDDQLTFTYDTGQYFGTGDFSFECFIWISAYSSGYWPIIYLGGPGATGNYQPSFGLGVENSGGKLRSIVGGTYIDHNQVTINTGQWLHVVACRSGGVYRTFIDGKLNGSTANTSNVTAGSNNSAIGGANFGGGAGTFYGANGYIDDLRVTNGVGLYSQNFVPPSQAVGQSLSGTNKTNSTTDFTSLYLPLSSDLNDDSSHAHTVTVSGNAAISSSSAAFGGYSAYFDGNDDYLTVANHSSLLFGSNDFTVEGHFNASSIGSDGLVGMWEDNQRQWLISFANGRLYAAYSTNGSAGTSLNSGVTPSTGTWYHFAFCRSGNTFRLFVSGVLRATATNSSALHSSTGALHVGSNGDNLGALEFHGYLQDVRVLNGFAKYVANFTPPTVAVTATVSQTRNDLAVLYMPFDDLQDKARNHPVTANGNAAVSGTQAKFGGKSLFIDASGDYLTVESNGDFKFGTNDFSISMFIRPDTINTSASAGSYAAILDYDGSQLNGAHFTLHQRNQTLVWVVQSAIGLTTSNCLTANTWHHVAVVRSSGTTSIIVDGNTVGSFSDTQNYTDTLTRSLYIGKQNIPNTRRFDGYIDDLIIVNGFAMNFPAAPTAASGGEVIDVATDTRTFSSVWNLNSPEVTEAFKAGTWPSQPVDTQYTKLYMSFDTNVQDESPSARSVTASGNAAVSNTQAKFGSSLYLDGSGDYLTVPHASDLNLAGSDFTIEAWVYNTSFPSGSGAVISKWTGSSKEFVVFTIASGLYFYWSHNGATNNLIQSTDGFSLNTWHHIAITSSSNVGRLFVDGQLQSATANFSSTPIYQSTTPVLIGARDGGGVSNFAGYIDDLMVLKGHAKYTSSFTPPTAASGGGI